MEVFFSFDFEFEDSANKNYLLINSTSVYRIPAVSAHWSSHRNVKQNMSLVSQDLLIAHSHCTEELLRGTKFSAILALTRSHRSGVVSEHYRVGAECRQAVPQQPLG